MPTKQVRFSEIVDQYEDRTEPCNLHPALCPEGCIPGLDFSMPSVLFRANSRLESALLNMPAYTPPIDISEVQIRVLYAGGMRGLCTIAIPPISTVGDVLTTIHEKLRQPVLDVPAGENIDWYHSQRVKTLDAYCSALNKRARRDTNSMEAATGMRRLDLLRGKVLFAGIVVPDITEPHKWELILESCERYTKQ
ncbi:hypothetical protein K438DRAFT_1987451 [Mycena galopus ATCC 62051]|nr:hypothetical protein K438DRAFT_1987451 [Mycena galopus ATCC 62051]